MRVLVVGNGGREHALAWKLAQSPLVEQVFATRPNAGMAEFVEPVDLGPTDILELVRLAKDRRIDLTVPGPEASLCAGIVDAFADEGLYAFGPTKACAEMEASKAFAKSIMARMGVPTAEYRLFQEQKTALEYVQTCSIPVVIKADGLAAGKGVRVCTERAHALETVAEFMGERIFGDAGSQLIVEECLQGRELSFIALVDGQDVLPLVSSQDHKRLLDGDEGPNTGGMGAFSPSPILDEALMDRVMHEVMYPTIRSLAERGLRYRGFLYAGLMITEQGPLTLEFNVRLGDPETQPIMMRLKSDLAEVLMQCRDGLKGVQLDWDPRPAVCLVAASEGYPQSPIKGRPITGLKSASQMENVQIFHAGTRLQDGEVITSGGRVLGVTALGDSMLDARRRAYDAVEEIGFEGMHVRYDIAASEM